MANTCLFEWVIAGKPENIRGLLDIIFDGEERKRLIPRTEIRTGRDEALELVEFDHGLVSMSIFGECDWSVYTSQMQEGKYHAGEKLKYATLYDLCKENAVFAYVNGVSGDMKEEYLINNRGEEESEDTIVEEYLYSTEHLSKKLYCGEKIPKIVPKWVVAGKRKAKINKNERMKKHEKRRAR